MTIRRLSPLHPDALALIDGSEREQAALYPPHLRNVMYPQELVDADVRCFVGHDADAPVGCSGYQAFDGYGELKRIYVAQDKRGQGWAETQVTACEYAACAEGLAAMGLETGDVSHAALRFYARVGYAPTGPFGGYIENGSSIFMHKALTP